EAERAEARPEVGDGDRAPARPGVPERRDDHVRLAAERGEGEAAEPAVDQHEERQRADAAREHEGERPEHGARLEEATRPEAVERPAHERAARAAEEQRRRLHRRHLAARAAELDDERQVEDGKRHQDAVLNGERHGRDREGAPRLTLDRPRVRHSPRSTRRSASAASIACRRWEESMGFVTHSNAPNARLRRASSAFARSFTMITFASTATAPSARASRCNSGSGAPVITTTLIARSNARIRLIASRPPRRGIRRSRTMPDGRARLTWTSASRPFAASTTSNPSPR